MKLLPVWARRWTSLPIRNIPARVRAGPNAGRRWSLAVSGRGVVPGRYEAERFEALSALLAPDDVVWDIGAHYGYATLIMAGIVGSADAVVAFEPSSANRWYLERHLRWNGMSGVRVMDCAVAEADRTDVFGGTGGSVTFHLGHEGEEVEVRSITSLVRSGLPFPSFVKIDVEGAEALALEGARPALQEARSRGEEGRPDDGPRSGLPALLVAVHDPPLYEACREILAELGYMVLPSKWIRGYLRGEPWKEDPDLLALPPRRHAEAPAIRRLAWFAEGSDP